MLGFGPTNPVPLEVAFTLDEPQPARSPLRPNDGRGDPAPARRRARARGTLPLDDQTPEEEDDPRRARSAAQPEQRVLWVPIAIVAGSLLLAAGVIAGVIIAGRSKPAETAQPQPDTPKPNPAPPTPRIPQTQPQPPEFQPDTPKPPQPLPFEGPTGFYQVWAKPAPDERAASRSHFGGDGRSGLRGQRGAGRGVRREDR